MILRLFSLLAFVVAALQAAAATSPAGIEVIDIEPSLPAIDTSIAAPDSLELLDTDLGAAARTDHSWISPYALPASMHCTGCRDWLRMWINTAVLSGAFIGTLFVLECLPEDATSWNRASIQKVPLFKRWYRNIYVRDPEWDHDKFIFNYVLHPYAGAAYFMAARSCGFSFWGSMLYSFAVSTIGWEFGIEAFMERPSYQDIVITPVVGSLMGEAFYRAKHAIVDRGYELLGSSFLGHFVCFLLDPVNEVVDLFRGSPTRRLVARRKAETRFALSPNSLSLTINF